LWSRGTLYTRSDFSVNVAADLPDPWTTSLDMPRFGTAAWINSWVPQE
jgi:hypothetical protein